MTTAPEHFLTLRERYPDLFDAMESVGESVRKLGPLESKTIELVQLAAAAASRSEGAVHSHARRAREAGATAAEIHQALLCLTSTIGFPAVSAAISWVEDQE